MIRLRKGSNVSWLAGTSPVAGASDEGSLSSVHPATWSTTADPLRGAVQRLASREAWVSTGRSMSCARRHSSVPGERVRCRRTRPPVENRRPDSSTRGRDDGDAAHGPRLCQWRRSVPDALTDRLQGLEPAPALGPHGGRCTRSYSDRPPRTQTPTPRRWSPFHVRSPHRIGGLRGDRAVVCLRAVRVATRCGAWRSCSRINRRTRSFEVRIPATRSFAHAFRYPSP